jgi:ribosome biogenesis ATPase
MAALEESLEPLENGALSLSSSCPDPSIELSHFEQALSKIKPSVSEQVLQDVLIIIRSASPSYGYHHISS